MNHERTLSRAPGGKTGHNLFMNFLTMLGVGTSLLVGCTDTGPQLAESHGPRPPVLLTAEVNRAEATTGDTITYTVTLDRDPDVAVEPPEVFSRIQGFKVSDIKEEGPLKRDGRWIHRQIFGLRAFKVGSYILPALSVQWTREDGERITVGAPQIFIEIKTVLDPASEKEDIADIKPPVSPPVDYKVLRRPAAALGLLLFLAGVGYWFYRRRQATRQIMPPAPPSWEVARAELTALQKRDLARAGDARTYCYELSEIFRRYLENRFLFPALEETTEEILASFRDAPVPHGRPQDIARRLLTEADQVKFAKHLPTELQAEELLQSARAFIDATVPSSNPSPGENAEEVGR